MKKPFVLIVLDGWGVAPPWDGNAISAAKTPAINMLWKTAPRAILGASEQAVGLPIGEHGNSEVGHLNIGCGQVVHQDLPSITAYIKDGSFFQNETLKRACDYAKKNNSYLHLVGLVSGGGTHSHIDHLFALLDLAKQEGLYGDRVVLHVFTDGRDTPPMEALHYIGMLEKKIRETGVGVIANVMGRFYPMDRENHWERVESAYRAMTEGVGLETLNPMGAVSAAYRKGQTDEFITPTIIRSKDQTKYFIKDNDSIIFFNYRSDRARQLTQAIIDPHFKEFQRVVVRKNLFFVAFTSYQEGLPVQIAFSPKKVGYPIARVFSEKGWRQLHVAETAKYPHVTYFFNGGEEQPFSGEDRILVASPDVDTYDKAPEMSAYRLTDQIISVLDRYDFIIVNYANLDLVGHSGNFKATVKAVEAVDRCLGKLITAVKKRHGYTVLTGDHGNAEQMVDPVSGDIYTEHSTNPVPFFFVTDESKVEIKQNGKLADIAPTILDYLNISIPSEMTGQSLLIK